MRALATLCAAALLAGCGGAPPVSVGHVSDVPLPPHATAVPLALGSTALWGAALPLDRAVLQTFGVPLAEARRLDLPAPAPRFEAVRAFYATLLGLGGFEESSAPVAWAVRAQPALGRSPEVAAFVHDRAGPGGTVVRVVVIVAAPPDPAQTWHVVAVARGTVADAVAAQHRGALQGLLERDPDATLQTLRAQVDPRGFALTRHIERLIGAGLLDDVARPMRPRSTSGDAEFARFRRFTSDGAVDSLQTVPLGIGHYVGCIMAAFKNRFGAGHDDSAAMAAFLEVAGMAPESRSGAEERLQNKSPYGRTLIAEREYFLIDSAAPRYRGTDGYVGNPFSDRMRGAARDVMEWQWPGPGEPL